MLPVALDAMGGDKAPEEIVAGAHRAVAELGVPVLLVGRPEVLEPLAGDLEVLPASEVIAMDADPGASVRRMKDSSLVRAAEAVRDGKASAMISAGNTGATMALGAAAHGPDPGREPAGHRHADPGAGPHPHGAARRRGQRRVPARVAACSSPRWAPCSPGSATASPSPGWACCRSARSPTKGTPLVKETHKLLDGSDALRAAGGRFIGNVEGRDVMTDDVDVVVTDGFTGNVVLKTLEGGMRTLVGAIFEAFGSTPETQAASEVLLPALMPLYASARPRQHRWGHAPRARGDLPDLPRLVLGHGRS